MVQMRKLRRWEERNSRACLPLPPCPCWFCLERTICPTTNSAPPVQHASGCELPEDKALGLLSPRVWIRSLAPGLVWWRGPWVPPGRGERQRQERQPHPWPSWQRAAWLSTGPFMLLLVVESLALVPRRV